MTLKDINFIKLDLYYDLTTLFQLVICYPPTLHTERGLHSKKLLN